MSEIVYGIATCFTAGEAGTVIQVIENMPYSTDEAVVKAHPELFVDVPPRLRDVIHVVEEATANPGELRRTRRV